MQNEVNPNVSRMKGIPVSFRYLLSRGWSGLSVVDVSAEWQLALEWLHPAPCTRVSATAPRAFYLFQTLPVVYSAVHRNVQSF